MGARLQINLDTEEERTLYELSLATTVPRRVQERGLMVRLSHQGLHVDQIATFMHRNVRTVRESLNRWKDQRSRGLMGCPSSRSAKTLARGRPGVSGGLFA